jgi:hypothetical protein
MENMYAKSNVSCFSALVTDHGVNWITEENMDIELFRLKK